MFENIYQYVTENMEFGGFESDGRFKLGGRRLANKSFFEKFLEGSKGILSGQDRFEFSELSDKEKRDIFKRIVTAREAEVKKNIELISHIDLDDLAFIQDMKDAKLVHVYSISEKKLKDDILHTSLESMYPPKLLAEIPMYAGMSVYDPLNTADDFKTVTCGQDKLVRVNMYRNPEWMSESFDYSDGLTVNQVFKKLPKSTQDYLRHLFPSKLSREYVLKWLANAMKAKHGNEHILVLNGPTGTGKTIFSQDLIKNLVGSHNWRQTPKNLFKSTFNKVLLNKRAIFIDEAIINQQDYETVKLYANNTMNIERKGFDADNTSELFFSTTISNNKIGNIYVDPDDRRFSIMDTTDVKMLEVFEDDWIDDLIKEFHDPKYMAQIATALMGLEDAPMRQFKGASFYKFVWRHLPQWKKVVVDRFKKLIKEGETEITIDKISMVIQSQKNIKYDVQPDTIREFIEGYLHEGHLSIGTMFLEEDVDGDDEWVVTVNPELNEEEPDL